MVGWREKPAAHQPVSGEVHENGAAKFRRKLNYGFAFISNPLSQRKTTPGRQQANVQSLAVTEPSGTDITTADSMCEPLLSSLLPSTSPKRSNVGSEQPATVPLSNNLPMSADTDVVPKPLPRSRTLSFIPLPVRSELNAFAAEVEGAVKSHSYAAMPRPEPVPIPSKIPTPSPPSLERHQSSTRQHVHQHVSYRASQQIKHIATAHALAAASNGSPVKHPYQQRSHTTPNLVKDSNPSRPARFMAPRRPGPKRTATSPIAQKPVLQENVPTDKRITYRRSQIQDRTLKRESLAVPGTLNNRRFVGPGPLLPQSREYSFVTPPTVRKRMSSQFAQQTPVTAKRIQPGGKPETHTPISPQVSTVTAVQPRNMSPSVLTPETIDQARPALPQSHTDRDLQRKTLGTPNGLGGVWRSSRALAVTTHEVRDYMPSLYWAGRFQARYDKWRTDAMEAELDPDYQLSGLLGECKLNQDKLAACYILGQLRDLCTSAQAADSLWEFEYKYRKDHKLLGNPLDMPATPFRKQDDTTSSAGAGAFGRAMRKLTPRKASLVNLMKGKGWNKSDEAKSGDVAERNLENESDCS